MHGESDVILSRLFYVYAHCFDLIFAEKNDGQPALDFHSAHETDLTHLQ